MDEGVARTLRLWFAFDDPVDARTYFRHGLALMVVKYAIDAILVWAATHRFWTPVDYLNPSLVLRQGTTQFPPTLQIAMALWTLPFLWIGVSMSVRRAVDAGRSAWSGLMFFVPLLNYVMMIVLSLLPTAREDVWTRQAPDTELVPRVRSALIGVGVSFAIGVPLIALCTLVLKQYGLALFLGTPFVVGAVTGCLHNRHHVRPLTETLFVVVLGQLFVGGATILFAIEGTICVLMALPLAIPLALMGGVLGREIALHTRSQLSHIGLVVLALPSLAAVEGPRPPAVFQAVSAIVVDAPPEVVWRHVVSFSDLPPPTEPLFRLGVAYPMRARIQGQGVGAVRRCEFSTGAFVEPITAWDAPRRLTFDVRDEPPPMRELSPWPVVHATHLDGYFRAVKGEFRLVPLPGGRTRLEGSTWYTLAIHPQGYWTLWANALVESIHHRVLVHIRHLAEDEA